MVIRVIKVEFESDLLKAQAIRREVFVEGQKVPAEAEIDEFEEEAFHYLALNEQNVPLGAARWRHTNEGIKLERFAVLNEYRHKGVASNLLAKILEDVKGQLKPGKKKIYLHSQIGAIPLYEKFHFVKTGDEFLECGIRHIPMEFVFPGSK